MRLATALPMPPRRPTPKSAWKPGHRFGAPRATEAALPAAFTEQHHRYGLGHDHQIFAHPLPLQVLEIVPHFSPDIVEARVVALIDLRPASNAGSRALPQRILGDVDAQPREYA